MYMNNDSDLSTFGLAGMFCLYMYILQEYFTKVNI